MKFRNEIAISSRWHALRLLVREGHRSESALYTQRGDPQIEVAFYGGPYDSHSRSDLWRIAPEVSLWLIRCGFVIGKHYWGGRHTSQWVATEQAERWVLAGAGLILYPDGSRAVKWLRDVRELEMRP